MTTQESIQAKHAIKGWIMRISIACFPLALLICLNEATFAADAYNGSRLAERWCMSCHIVSSAQSGGIDGTLSFASITQKADFSAEKLTFFLLDPHPTSTRRTLLQWICSLFRPPEEAAALARSQAEFWQRTLAAIGIKPE